MSTDTPSPDTRPLVDRMADGACEEFNYLRGVDSFERLRKRVSNALAAAREEGRIEERATLGRLPSFNIPISELEEGSEAVPDLSAMFTALAAARREGARLKPVVDKLAMLLEMTSTLSCWACMPVAPMASALMIRSP